MHFLQIGHDDVRYSSPLSPGRAVHRSGPAIRRMKPVNAGGKIPPGIHLGASSVPSPDAIVGGMAKNGIRQRFYQGRHILPGAGFHIKIVHRAQNKPQTSAAFR